MKTCSLPSYGITEQWDGVHPPPDRPFRALLLNNESTTFVLELFITYINELDQEQVIELPLRVGTTANTGGKFILWNTSGKRLVSIGTDDPNNYLGAPGALLVTFLV